MAYNQITTFHLFAGAGGGILADILLGHSPIGACEIEEYPRNVLLQRQRDGILPEFPIWDDICTLDGKPWRGKVDVVCGGFPCQDISAAGKGAGIDGERSGLWGEMARIIREIRPRYAFVENSPMLTSRGLHRVLGDLAEMGYDAKWCVLGACDAGARHKRDRIWILGELADASVHGLAASEEREGADERSDERTTGAQPSGESEGLCAAGELKNVADANGSGSNKDRGASELRTGRAQQSPTHTGCADSTEGGEVAQWWQSDPADISDATGWGREINGIGSESEGPSLCGEAQHLGKCGSSTREASGPAQPLVGRVAHGVADRVDRLKAIGNGQVPQCAALAFNILSNTKFK